MPLSSTYMYLPTYKYLPLKKKNHSMTHEIISIKCILLSVLKIFEIYFLKRCNILLWSILRHFMSYVHIANVVLFVYYNFPQTQPRLSILLNRYGCSEHAYEHAYCSWRDLTALLERYFNYRNVAYINVNTVSNHCSPMIK